MGRGAPQKGAHCALCPCCAKSRPFSTTGSHRSQGPEFCTVHPPCWYIRDFCFSVMLATGPRVLNSAPHAVLNLNFRGVPGINNVIIGGVRTLCLRCAETPPSERHGPDQKWRWRAQV